MLIIGGEFYTGLNTTIFRIIFLLVANFCLIDNWAYFYSLFCIFSALYLIDPIGLFFTGPNSVYAANGVAKNVTHNIVVIIAFGLLLVAAYVGYLFAK